MKVNYQDLTEAIHNNEYDKVSNLITDQPQLFEQKTVKEGYNPLHLAALYGKTQIFKLIWEGIAYFQSLNRSEYFGAREIIVSVNFDVEVSQLNKAELSSEGFSYAHLAAASGVVELLDYLASIRPELLTRRSVGGLTTLHMAASYGKIEMYDKIADKCREFICGVKSRDLSGETSLHVAIKSKEVAMINHMADKYSELFSLECSSVRKKNEKQQISLNKFIEELSLEEYSADFKAKVLEAQKRAEKNLTERNTALNLLNRSSEFGSANDLTQAYHHKDIQINSKCIMAASLIIILVAALVAIVVTESEGVSK